ncbi:hypothetical protein SAMN02745116_00725 [Pilibacter termitis]|uniref:Uncharacterized protein n=1 Tax=Pilibacter termitis TaxID=263852 RepID=A0A1T4LMJ4_9ENTE|nr:hypothetical protein [Pilibacter termitis]SJZ55935.1 hypothetical protein SAMN02745116_00725 [Pilibacter termitis]
MRHDIYLPEAKLQVALRTATKLLPLAARNRKAKKCVLKSVAASHGIYLPEAELQVTLRTATRLQHFAARH